MITKVNILELGLHNVTVKAAITLYEEQKVTWEEAMQAVLVHQNNALLKEKHEDHCNRSQEKCR